MSRLFAFLVIGSLAAAQDPLSTELRTAYTIIRNNLIKMAERMPEEHYSFKPVTEVQTFQLRMAHIADANMRTCSGLLGERKSVGAAAKTVKVDLIAAVKESFATCDRVFDAMRDRAAAELVPGELGSPVMPAGTQRTRLSTLWNLIRHSNELYGYMSVYMRIKGIVPPSTAPQD